MQQDDCIAVALGLPQLKILWQQELEGYIEVTVIYRRGEATCPRCGKVAHKEHDRRRQNKQDRRLRDKVVFLYADEEAVSMCLPQAKMVADKFHLRP